MRKYLSNSVEMSMFVLSFVIIKLFGVLFLP